VYIYYIRERYYFSLVCGFEKAVKNIGVKVHVQKGALLGLRKKVTMGLLVSPNSHCHPSLSCVHGPQ
jgi:hypothetical protein